MPDAIPMQFEVDVIPPINNISVQERNEQDDQEFHEELLGRGHRQKQSLVLLHDYVTHTIPKLSSFPLTPKPQHSSIIHVDRETVTYSEALKDERWRHVMQHEIQAL